MKISVEIGVTVPVAVPAGTGFCKGGCSIEADLSVDIPTLQLWAQELGFTQYNPNIQGHTQYLLRLAAERELRMQVDSQRALFFPGY